MRTLMTLMTLGAAGAGYVYLNQIPVAGEPYNAKPDTLSLFNWKRDSASKSATSRIPTKDLVNRIHEQTKSVLQDFANQNGSHSDAPVDDAFQRLQQVVQSAGMTSSAAKPSPHLEFNEKSQPAIVPLPSLDELQRTAFDPAVAVEAANDSIIHEVSDRVTTTDVPPKSKPLASQGSTGKLEPTSTANRPTLVETIDSSKPNQAITNVSKPTATDVSKRSTPNGSEKREKKVATAEWKVVGKTTEGRPMHTMHLGENGTRTLVIAGLNGEDRTAVRWLELLAEELARHPDLLKTNEVVFFRAGNPDGLIHNRRDNSRGVPLNRNFPSRRYRPTTDTPRTAVPAGEVETRVILDTLYTFRPRRVIHLAATSGRSQVLYNRLAKNTAVEFERSAKVGLMPLDFDQYPGSIEDFSEGTLEAGVLSMRLNADNDWQQAWTRHQPHVLSAVVGQPIDPVTGDAVQIFDPDRSPIPTTNAEPVSRRPRRRGYEELPPPPQ